MTKVEIFNAKKAESISEMLELLNQIRKAENITQMRKVYTNVVRMCEKEISSYSRMATFLSAKDEFDPDDQEKVNTKNLIDHAIPFDELTKYIGQVLYIFWSDMPHQGKVTILLSVNPEANIIYGNNCSYSDNYGTNVFAIPVDLAVQLHPEYFCSCNTCEKPPIMKEE